LRNFFAPVRFLTPFPNAFFFGLVIFLHAGLDWKRFEPWQEIRQILEGRDYLQVSQEFVEQVVQLEEDVLIRLLPPPMPKEEMSFWMSLLPHSEQATVFSAPIDTRVSKCFPHFLHKNSYIGIVNNYNSILHF